MRVTDLARRADTTAETVRHYTDLGLLTPRRDPHNGYRQYNGVDLSRLRFGRSASAPLAPGIDAAPMTPIVTTTNIHGNPNSPAVVNPLPACSGSLARKRSIQNRPEADVTVSPKRRASLARPSAKPCS